MKSDTKSYNSKNHNLFTHTLITLLCLGAAILTFLMGQQQIKNRAVEEQSKEAEKFLKLTESIFEKTLKTLTFLNAQQLTECNKTTLVKMRREVFGSQYLKDVGMFDEDYLVCTTGLGKLREKIIEPPAAYTDQEGILLWPNRKLLFFDKPYEAIIIRLGQFNAVIDPNIFKALISSDYRYEVVFSHQQKVIHVLGERNQFTIPESVNYSRMILRSSHCSQEIPFCIALKLKEDRLFASYQLVLVTLSILSILVFVVLFVWGQFFLSRHYSLLTRVARGYRKNRFYPLFQPLVELESGKIIGCEVLARFHDSKGMIPPDQFIPLIRSRHNTWDFTRDLMSKTFALLEKNKAFPEGFLVNFNIFPQDISSGKIDTILTSRELINSRFKIGLEITEDQALDISASTEILKRLSAEGFCIAIDDFGTGYSNLNELRYLDCNVLKIDRSFINEMEDSSIRSTLIPHIVSIAEELELKVVAEGIENGVQASALMKAGVTYGQGWHYGKPMKLDELLRKIKQSNNP